MLSVPPDAPGTYNASIPATESARAAIAPKADAG
jgi:hypothetical protein